MKNKINLLLLFVVLLGQQNKVKAQLSGVYNVPSTYTSISSAINDLNAFGVMSPVTINIASGYTETAIAGGFTLNNVVGTSSVNTITFQKSGTGANPVIVAYTGTATPTSAIQDGVWRFIGCDYVTLDGIDIRDNNTTNPGTMEFGYGFFKAGVTDGCQNNTVKNCTITLNRVNNAAASSPAVDGSRGIDVVNALTNAHTTALSIISSSGANSNNKFYSNLIQNCNYGIAIIGFVDVSPFTNADTGNDVGGNSVSTGNTIINYGGGGTSSPASAIRTLAQYNFNASYNLINSNNGAGVLHAQVLRGIYLGAAVSANASINNNTITVRGGGTTNQLSPIENLSGSTGTNNAISISNNLITNCNYTTATTGVWYGIFNSGASAANVNISGNIFSNNSTNGTSGAYYNIYQSGAVTGSITISSNTLSGISFSAASTSITNYNIYNTTSAVTATVNVNNNVFQNYTYSGATGGTGVWAGLYILGTAGRETIQNNIFVNLSLKSSSSIYLIYCSNASNIFSVNSNSVVGSFSRTAASATGVLYSIYNGSGTQSQVSADVFNNNFSNMSNGPSSGTMYMCYWYSGGSLCNIYNNVFNNITALSGTGTFAGIYGPYYSALSNVYNNTVTNVTYGTGTIYGFYYYNYYGTLGNVYGNTFSNLQSSGGTNNGINVYYTGGFTSGGTFNFYNNKTTDIRSSNVSASNVSGINCSAIVASNINIHNNLIANITASASTNANAVMGLNISSTTSGVKVNANYNSIYLSGTSTGSGFGSSGIYANTIPGVVLMNNIVVNNCTPVGTGSVAAYRRSSSTISSYSLVSNNNLFYAGTPGTNNVIYADGLATYPTLSAYKSYLTNGQDAVSVTENVPFLSTVSTATNFLNISTSVATQVESGAAPISGITTDYAGNTRNANFPDIGAFEGNYIPAGDFAAPLLLSYGYTTSPCITSARTLTISLADLSGVGSGTATPRVYYKVNSGTYSSVSGTLSTGTATNGVWAFDLSYSSVINDIISWYLVTQDIASTPNLKASPSAGFSGTDVNTVITPPTTPYTFLVAGSMTGVYTVGSTGTYTSLTAAAFAYNTNCLSGPITFSLTDALYNNTTEVFPIVFQNNTFASATNSLLILPAAGTSVVISNTASSGVASVLKFSNARYITVDGINASSTNLSVNNLCTSGTSNIWLASSSNIGNSFIALKNIEIRGGSYTGTSIYGINASSDGANPSIAAGADNDNVVVQSNTLLNVYHGLYAIGTSSASVGGLDNWNITGNTFGSPTQWVNSIGGHGIYLSGAINLSITLNTLQNFTTTTTGIAGIYLASNINSLTVSQNTLLNIYSTGSGSYLNSNCGLYVGSNVINGAINNNILDGIVNVNSAGWGLRGMIVGTGNANSNLNIYNNMILNVRNYDCCTSIAYSSVGLEIGNSTGGINIDHNTIYLSGSSLGSTPVSAAINFYSTSGGNVKLRNNILVNTYGNTTSDQAFAIYSSIANTNFSVIDNNNYFVGGLATTYLGYLGSNRATLANLQTGFGQNANSTNLLPVFASANDLHLVPSSFANYLLDNTGTTVSNVTTDIDFQSRSVTNPDMGADEWTSTATCTTASGGSISVASYTACSTQTLALNSNSVSVGLSTSYQWQVSPTSGSGYTNVAAGIGATTTSFKTPTLTAGTYYFVLMTTCTAVSANAISNEVTVTVNSAPNPTISSTASAVCTGNSATLTASGATSYTWSTGATTDSIVITPTSSSNYYVTGGSPGCTNSTSANYAVSYAVTPTLNFVSTPTAVCYNIPTAITASGAATYSWDTGATGATAMLTLTTPTTFTVIGTNAGVCSSSATIAFAVNPNPTVSIVTSSVCAGQMANLIASGALTYSWNTGATTNSITPSPTTNTTYTVTGTDALGCSHTLSQLVTVGALPNVAIAGSPTVCTGQSLGLIVSGATTYTWDTGSNSNSISITPTTNTTYSVIGTDALGCQNSTTQLISLVANPVISITGSSSVCTTQSLSLTAGGASTYSWNTGATGATAVFSPSVNSTYTVTGTDAQGCFAMASHVVTLTPNPVLFITGASSICAGESASLTVSGANTYSWNTGSTSNSIVTTPTANVTYNVIGTDLQGCNTTTTQLLTVAPFLTVTISGSLSICEGQNANLTGNGGSSYVWNTGATTQTIAPSPTVTTTYSIVGTSGTCTNSGVATVTVNSNPIVSITGASSVCTTQSLSLTASGAVTYVWNTGATSAIVALTPTANTTYTVTGTDAIGCYAMATQVVTLTPNPVLTFAGSTGICTGQTATLTISGANTYSWDTGSTTNSIVTNPVVSTTYTVTGTDLLGCKTTTSQLISVAASLSISIAGPSSICVGQVANLTGNGGVTYTWNTGATTQTIAPSPTVTTTYSIIGASGTCSNTGMTTITVNQNPTVSISGVVPTCLNQTITLTASGAVTYTWNTGSNSSTIQSSSGAYTLVGTNAFGCNNEQTANVIGLPVPTIGITQSSNNVCINSPASFTASGADTYTWSTASNNTIITITPTVAATYSIIGTNSFGCISSETFALGTYTLPVLNIVPASATVCSLSQASFNASGATTYTWNNSVFTQTASFTPTTSSVYTLSGTNPAGCVSTVTLGITTNTLPILNIVPASATICAFSTASFAASGANTYTWNGSVNTSTAAFSPSVSSVYTLSGTNPAGCVKTTTLGVNTNTLPIINVAQSANTICVNSPATFTASGANTYTWSTVSNNTIISITPTVAANYTVTGTSGFGCVSSRTFALATYTLPVLAIVPASATVCSMSQASFNASGATSYTWNGTIFTQTAAFTPTSSTVYTLVGRNSSSCVSTTTVGVTTNTLPVLAITPPSATVCVSSPTTFSASGATSYTWSGSVISSSVVFTPTAASTVYTITGVNPAGCRTTNSIAVSTNTLPIITISPASASVCALSTSTYSPIGANTYTWINTSTNTLISVSASDAGITPTSSAIYTVTGTNGFGCVSSRTLAVGVFALPVLNITPASPTVCSLSQVTYTASGASTYTWSGAITTATAAYVPTVSTVYTLTGMSVNNCVSTTTVAVITNSLPIVTINSSTNTTCVFSPVTYTANGASTYTWSNNSIGSTVTVFPASNATYTVVGTDALGCVSANTVAINTNSLPLVSISPSVTTICVLQNTTLTASGATTYSWSSGAASNNAIVSPTTTTNYSVVGTNSLGCIGIANAVVITNTLPVISISASSATNCANSAVSFTANGGNTYTWSTASNNTVISVTPSASSTYTVIGSDLGNGCLNSSTVALTTFSLPIITFSSSASAVCIGKTASITAIGAQTYSWNTGATAPNIAVAPSTTTVYAVNGKDGLGCSSNGTVSLTVYNLPNVAVSPTVQTICEKEIATFTASGAATYTWIPDNSNSNTFTASPLSVTFYTLSGTDANNCSNQVTFLLNVNKCVGVAENLLSQAGIKVFPNPSRGIFNTGFDFEGKKEITIINAIGQVILQINTESMQETFDLSGYGKGVYYIKISAKHASANFKVISE